MVNQILRAILKELVSELPLSLIIKLSDGKLTTQELVDLSTQIAKIIYTVLAEELNIEDDNSDEEQIVIDGYSNKAK